MANTQEIAGRIYRLHIPKQLFWWGGVLVVAIVAYVLTTNYFERVRLSLSPTRPAHYAVAAFEAVRAGDEVVARQIMASAPQPAPEIFPETRLTTQLASVSAHLETQPTAVELLLQKAVVLSALRRDDEARETLRYIEKLDPNTPAVRVVLDRLYATLW